MLDYGCNIYIHADARICLKMRLLYSLTEIVPFSSLVQLSSPIFLLLSQSRCQYPNNDFLKHHCTAISTTLGCNTSAVGSMTLTLPNYVF